MSEPMDPFLEYRKAQEMAHSARIDPNSTDPMDSLITVELNITELCNRTCVFCPRVDPSVYPNRNLKMDLDTTRKVGRDLAEIGYVGRISFSGFGECLLNKEFEEHIKILRALLPDNLIETNTNGDRLTVEKLHSLFDAGLSAVYVNMYDGPEQYEPFKKLFEEAGLTEDQWKLRPHWPGCAEDFGLVLNNRSGMVANQELGVGPLEEALEQRCHYPFYKMFVDWNGNVLFCSNDWGREIIIGNVLESHVRDIWMSQHTHQIRQYLARGERSFSPCNKCDVKGTLHGKTSFEILSRHYAREGDEQFAEQVEREGGDTAEAAE
jgi:radical SAM protein with 4Fe4S-binding SPASM domain